MHTHSRRIVLLFCCGVLATAAVAEEDRVDHGADLPKTCVTCHGDGEASIPGWPPIKSLSKQELTSKLTTYRNQRVPESRMTDVTHDFTDQEIEVIADYFSKK